MGTHFNPVPKPQKREKPKNRNSLTSRRKKKKPSDLRAWVNSLHEQPERVTPTRKERGEITGHTYEEMLARDKYRCVRCGAQNGEMSTYKGVPFFKRLEGHHITFRSQGGTGELRNAATVCGPPTQSGTCHHWAHTTREGREWFERWRDENLDERGWRKDESVKQQEPGGKGRSDRSGERGAFLSAIPRGTGRWTVGRSFVAAKKWAAIRDEGVRGDFGGADGDDLDAERIDIIDE